VSNSGTWEQFSGELTNSGGGYGADNAGTWTDFSGNLVLGSLTGTAIDGDAIPFSGTISIAAQPDLAAGNILTGKTILGVAGSLPSTATTNAANAATITAAALDTDGTNTDVALGASTATIQSAALHAAAKAQQLATDQAAAPAAMRRTGTALGGVAGNILATDVRSDTVTGAAAGGTYAPTPASLGTHLRPGSVEI
jgi:hypothetical protein